MNSSRFLIFPALAGVSLFLIVTGCSTNINQKQPSEFYSLNDFKVLPKFDTHVHKNTTDQSLIEQAQADNFRLLSINLSAPGYPTISQQQDLALKHTNDYPDKLAYATTFFGTKLGRSELG